ncbi:carbon monoxide dehydrogenase subunit G [Streptomyces aquilus]|uniref:Carbon monoxide dehydrogenase subunit G n=1 Tax=Streptomyces aquilus TaxID=2548456 RepID=A0A3Q9C2F2_9ACTN|nr:SRPBCC domain-containing protein [Streptomyces aquilus]AZP19282.1 carbon monoxide dehydrogenase subunit G [Streptomyces aquilus]
MEHEVFVPVPAERLREALADPLRVARAVPGLQQDAGAEPVTGRLKVRVGSHSVTYRGTARLSARDDGTYAVEGEAAEARGSGTVKLTLTLRLTAAEGGTTLTFGGTAAADGRITELPGESVTSAVTRLLNRFAENLGSQETGGTAGTVGTGEAAGTTGTTGTTEPEATEVPEAADVPEAGEVPEAAEEPEPEAPSADPDLAEDEDQAEAEAEDHTTPRDLPAEAAHARRTMIGRSAEEVDHAPPRGRYAPVPAPQTIAPNPALRWAAPAAAVALASAIVVTRALRKRR